MLIDLDSERTIWHERAVVNSAKLAGEDPQAALQQSRELRSYFGMMFGRDLRLPIREAKRRAARTSHRQAS